ncbi:MAG: hypothetical protein RJA70_102 [Pseudomonadota bacterium]
MLAPAVIVAMAALQFRVQQQFIPAETWLLWSFLTIGLSALTAAIACLALGYRLLSVVHKRLPSLPENVAVSGALGLLSFALLVFCFGVAGALRNWTFFLIPILMLVLAGRQPWRELRKTTSRLRAVRKRRGVPIGFPMQLLLGGGAFAILLTWLPTLSPVHVGYDSAWYHLPIAEHYAAAGEIAEFAEGWYQGTQPQLASWLYTWAFLFPGSVAERAILCMQMEAYAFIFTLFGVVALASRLGGGLPSRASWLVYFLFPGVFFYDLSAGADRITALFAAPLFCLGLTLWRRPSPRSVAIFAALASGAALTKVMAAILVLPICAAIALRLAHLWILSKRGKAVPVSHLTQSICVLVAGCLLLTAPHWLKNWLWYGDPLYPLLNKYFAATPLHQDAADILQAWTASVLWRPTLSLAGATETVYETARYAFVGHEWVQYTRGIPTNGILFTASFLCIPLLRRARLRLAGSSSLVWLGIGLWYIIHHQDRYLQALVPVMAAVSAVTLAQVWRIGALARIAIAVAVALQLVSSLEVCFWPSRHAWMQDVYNRFSSAYRQASPERDGYFQPWLDVGRALPPNAKLLVHDEHIHLGIGAQSVSDWIPWQGGVNYGRLGDPGAVWEALSGLGVTHLAYRSAVSKSLDSLGSDLVFHSFADRYAEPEKELGVLTLARMPRSRPQGKLGDVAYWGCGASYKNGVYAPTALTVQAYTSERAYPPPLRAVGPELLENVDAMLTIEFIVIEPACFTSQSLLIPAFRKLLTRSSEEIWVRADATR